MTIRRNAYFQHVFTKLYYGKKIQKNSLQFQALNYQRLTRKIGKIELVADNIHGFAALGTGVMSQTILFSMQNRA
jgi:hypothetical protein